MTDQIVLTTAQADDLDKRGLFVIKTMPPVTQGGSVRSPWFASDQPCSTCDGKGWHPSHPLTRDMLHCATCHGTGRQVVELVTECVHGLTQGLAMSRGAICSLCRNSGLRSLGLHTIGLQEIHDKLVSIVNPPLGTWYVVTDDYTVSQTCDGHSMDTFAADLPPDARPGMYVAICSAVTT